MPVQILSTKVSIPKVRHKAVLRSRLMQKLNQRLENGVILISTPAGYGKSTLLSSWLSQLEMPLVYQGVLVGRLNLGERIGGAGYKPQECQLIQQAADGLARIIARFTHV